MKRLLLIFVFAFTASAMQAQNEGLYSLMFHGQQEEYTYIIRNLMQQHGGDFIINTYLFEDIGNYNSISLGNVFYKISRSTLAVTDSLFIADTTSYYLSGQDPHGEGNIRINLVFHDDCDSTFLCISHFPDNDFNVNPDEDVVVPLCEGYVSGFSFIVDCMEDLIILYDKEIDDYYDMYAARFGLDGTLKYQTLMYENSRFGASRLGVLKESPLKYYQWGRAETDDNGYQNLIVYVIDSLFNKNPIIISSLLSEEAVHPGISVYEHFNIDMDTEVIPIGGDNILVAAKYVKDTTSHPMTAEYGVVVAKYDIRTMQSKGYIVFNDYPTIYNSAVCLGIKMMTDGSVYFLYKEHGYPSESVIIVKMDTDLNVEWKRFCKTDNIDIRPFTLHNLLYKDEQGEEKGIVWAKKGKDTDTHTMGWVLFFLNHDGTVGTNEIGMEVRPYTFYPNPVKEQLRMEFSPDVQPAQVELYDLQGRLLRTQDKTFESIDMSQLPSGTYTVRVTLEDGKSYTDKVVKE